MAYDKLFLTVNPSKCHYLLCSVSPRPLHLSCALYIGGVQIPEVSSLKYLGVFFDRKLDFQENALKSATKMKRSVGSLRRCFGMTLGHETFSYLYSTKCLPILTYALSVSSPRTKFGWLCLEKAHRLGLRYCTNNFSASYQALQRSVGSGPVTSFCFRQRSMLIHKYVHGLRSCPSDLPLITVQIPRSVRGLRPLGHELQLVIPEHKRQLTGNIPIYNALATWNALSFGSFEETFQLLNASSSQLFACSVRQPMVFEGIAAACPLIYPTFSEH